MLRTVLNSLVNSSMLWVLWGMSLFYGIKLIFRSNTKKQDIPGLLGFYGVFAFVIYLFEIGVSSWVQIVNNYEQHLQPLAVVSIRIVMMSLGYQLAKRHVYSQLNVKEDSTNASAKNISRFFIEFIAVCGGIVGLFIAVFLIVVLEKLLAN